jgi:hypothetical protein
MKASDSLHPQGRMNTRHIWGHAHEGDHVKYSLLLDTQLVDIFHRYLDMLRSSFRLVIVPESPFQVSAHSL